MADHDCPALAAHLHYTRLGSQALVSALNDGPFSFVLEVVRDQGSPPLLDLRFRANPKRPGVTQVALYFSGYRALMLEARQDGFGLEVARKGSKLSAHAEACGFDPAWLATASAEAWRSRTADVACYITRTCEYALEAKLSNVGREGLVQAALCAHAHERMNVIDREAAFAAPSTRAYEAVLRPIAEEVLAALAPLGTADWRRGLRKSLGGEADALAISDDGRLLVIEVKPADEFGTGAWAPAQAFVYARLFEAWADTQGRPQARAVLEAMADQRSALGLGPPLRLKDEFEIVPIVAYGAPSSDEDSRRQAIAVERMAEVRGALATAGMAGNLEFWTVAAEGTVTAMDAGPAAGGGDKAR